MRLFLSGNEAIAYGLLEGGVRFITGYPGTPSSEIIPSAIEFKKKFKLCGYFEWATNEKVAFEEAYAASLTGINAAVTFKQVGLNVAMDPFMNAALVGTVGGFVVVSVDDPGPHSSQTEQDSRFLAFFAKIPVFDPSTPKEAYEFAIESVLLSRSYSVPVMLRSSTRISHSRRDIGVDALSEIPVEVGFKRDTNRFAATPHFRYILHKKLNEKISVIKKHNRPSTFFSGGVLILTSGISFAHLHDLVLEYGLQKNVTLAKMDMPFPMDQEYMESFIARYKQTVVIEETYPLMEMQLLDRRNIKGRLDGTVPSEGEITPDACMKILERVGVLKKKVGVSVAPPFKKPSLCPGCGHRSAFFVMKKVFGDGAIYTGDIGCYTLGLNMGAVDTVHCMGASVSFAFGLSKVYSMIGREKTIVATIGDSTFFHSGVPALIDAVHYRVPFVLVILDNSTVAMTGNQKTQADSESSSGEEATPVSIENLVRGIGVEFLRVEDPYHMHAVEAVLEEAREYVGTQGRVAVVVLRHPCVYSEKEIKKNVKIPVIVNEELCKGCRICVDKFECPSIGFDESRNVAFIDKGTCISCGQCIYSCPFDAIEVEA